MVGKGRGRRKRRGTGREGRGRGKELTQGPLGPAQVSFENRSRTSRTGESMETHGRSVATRVEADAGS